MVRSGIFRSTDPGLRRLLLSLFWLLGKSSSQGCQTALEAAVNADENLNGAFLADCRRSALFVNRAVGDAEVEEGLWEATRDAIGV